MDYDDLLILLRALHLHDVDYVLVGGVAVNLHGLARATEVVDLFVRPDEENVAKLRRALSSVWADEEIEGITAEDLSGSYPTIRYGPPGTDYAIDILARLGTAVSYADLVWEVRDLDGVPVRLATPETLCAIEGITIPSFGRSDAEALRKMFDLED